MAGPNGIGRSLWPAILLAWIAGTIDALGYLQLAHVFTAHMSGNAAAFGAQLGQAQWHEVLLRILPVPAFLGGITVGAIAVRLLREGQRGRLVPAFALEFALVVIFVLSCPPAAAIAPGSLRYAGLVWLLAAAMGVQSATLHRAGGSRIQTTFVSGMIARVATEFGGWIVEHLIPARREGRHHGRIALVSGVIFGSFLAGAITGGVLQARFEARGLVVPAFGLLIVIVDDLIRPAPPAAPASEHGFE
ncbi:MAG TPA: YoaK family protein [Lacunisphaera sp.]|nr:YoaK family protein [Lacunisphaera sp.]